MPLDPGHGCIGEGRRENKAMVRSFSRGWPLIVANGQWIYEDTCKSLDEKRPCQHCGQMPTPEGYDACLGYIHGAISACCGHGINEPYIRGEGER